MSTPQAPPPPGDADGPVADGFRVRPVGGLGEVGAGDDLAALIDRALTECGISLADGDVLVVASKVVSKAEGRVRHGLDRESAVTAETVRVVAQRGRTRIVQTRHGFVMAAAGVDESNVQPGSVVLLPLDPDGSARALRAELIRRTGARIGVVVTDTFGRPWRLGQTDLAIGAAGVVVLDTYAGQVDDYGNPLLVTAPALADELASAADLAKPKLSGVPVAVVSGLGQLVTAEDGPGVAIQVRPADEDMFRLGTREAIASAALLPRGDARLADQDADVDHIERLIAEVLEAAESGDRETSGPSNVATSEPRPWVLTPWRDQSRRGHALRTLGLGASVPYVLAVRVPGDGRVAPALLLHLGALLDRMALALTVAGFGVRRATEGELRTLDSVPEHRDAGEECSAAHGVLVALLAVGVPAPAEESDHPKPCSV